MRGDKPVGLILSGGYGHRIGQSLALAIIDADIDYTATPLRAEIVGRSRAVSVLSDGGVYDPDNTLLKGVL
jgi:dimethylglycine dehydrogenase